MTFLILIFLGFKRACQKCQKFFKIRISKISIWVVFTVGFIFLQIRSFYNLIPTLWSWWLRCIFSKQWWVAFSCTKELRSEKSFNLKFVRIGKENISPPKNIFNHSYDFQTKNIKSWWVGWKRKKNKALFCILIYF